MFLMLLTIVSVFGAFLSTDIMQCDDHETCSRNEEFDEDAKIKEEIKLKNQHLVYQETLKEEEEKFEKLSEFVEEHHMREKESLDGPEECPLGLWHHGLYYSGEQLEKIRKQQMQFGHTYLKAMSKLKVRDFEMPRFAKPFLDRLKKKMKNK